MKRLSAALACAFVLFGQPCQGWWPKGHGILTRAAVYALPEELPAFFRTGSAAIAHYVFDPDVAKNRGTPLVRGAEHPEHFIDLEYLKGNPLPKGRYEFISLCVKLGVKPERVGFLPYAISEWTERLAVAFAEHRKWPSNPIIQNKCLVYAGFIAHYAQDVCQPLHLTIHYNGRANPDGSSPRTGIHQKVDGLIEFLGFGPEGLARGQKIDAFGDVMEALFDQIDAGRALIDLVYDLEADLPDMEWGRERKPVASVKQFATERAREAVRFTAALYLTAWRMSEKVELPDWLDRAEVDDLKQD